MCERNIASWKLQEESPTNKSKKGILRDDGDSWLEDQSEMTDSDIKEAVDVKIHDETFLRNLI